MMDKFSWSAALLVSFGWAGVMIAGCSDDEEPVNPTNGPTAASTTTSSGAGGTGGATTSGGGMGGSGGDSTSAGGMGGDGGTGGAGGEGGSGGGPTAPNQLTNEGFEMFSAGANPPFDPPDDWVTFGSIVTPFAAVGYDQYATQAHMAPIFNPSNPGDQSNLFPGYMDSRALKAFGRAVVDGAGPDLQRTLGTIYQEYTGGTVTVGSDLTLTGWAYMSSVDPLGADSNAYLVIKCFPDDFSQEYCGGGTGAKSTLITSATTPDTWTQFSVTVTGLDANTTIVQAGVEFDQCASGTPCTPVEGAGAVFWDELYFSWE